MTCWHLQINFILVAYALAHSLLFFSHLSAIKK